MKKLLAILLTLIFTFSCFGALGTTAMAEEAVAQASDYNVLIKSDFSKPLYPTSGHIRWVDLLKADGGIVYGNSELADENGDGITDYVKVGTNAQLYSPIVLLEPGKDYEFTFKMRIPLEYDYKFSYQRDENGELILQDDGKVKLAASDVPEFEILQASTNTKQNGQMISNVSGARQGAGYAYPGETGRRQELQVTWQVQGYEEYTYVNKGNSGFGEYGERLYPALGVPSTTFGGAYSIDPSEKVEVDLNEVFAEWKTVSVKFTAMASTANGGAQVTTVRFGKKDNSLGFDIKDFEVRELLRTGTERTVFESVLTKDGNMTAFDGSNKNQDSEYVTFANGENDYIELRSQSALSTAVTTAPFNVFPGNEYEISYKLRIPTSSASYLFSGFALSPEWSIYEVDERYIQDHKPGNRNFKTNAYARKDYRTGFSYNYSYEFSKSLTGSRETYSFIDYNGSSAIFGKTNNVTELFAGEWVTVTLKFTALASSTNSGAELCALSLSHTSDTTLADTLFQIKDVTVKETYFDGKATPLYTAEAGYVLDVEDFEHGATVGDVAKFYGSENLVEIGWAKNGSEIAIEGDNSFLKAFAHDNSIFLPLDTARLAARKNFTVSFDWMFKNTGVDFALSTIQIVGYNDGVFQYEQDGVAKEAPCVKDVTALAQLTTPVEFNFGEWKNATLKFIINENNSKYNHYGLLIKYSTKLPEGVTEYTADNSSIYIDNFTLAGCDELLAGDYDNDGDVSLQDLAKLAQYFAGWSSAKLYVDSVLADYSGDGARNLYDLVKFAQDLANP